MHDSPYTAETSTTYLEHVMRPLAKGEGVACFLATDEATGDATVVFCTHVLSGAAEQAATSDVDQIRALHALAIQRAARQQAESQGFHPLIA